MSVSSTGLEVDTLTSIEELASIEEAWWDLWRIDPRATPFQSPGWLLPWTRWLWGGGQLRVLAIRSGSTLVALAPLFLWGYGGDRVHVSFLGSGITDYLDILAVPEFQEEAPSFFLTWLAEHRQEWDDCDLQELRGDAPLLRAAIPVELQSACDDELSVCPVVPLPANAEQFESTLDAKFRRNLRNAEHRLANDGNVEFVTAAGHEVQDFLRTLFHVHAARWQERDQNGMLATEKLQQFHLEAAPRLFHAGLARLHAMRVNGETVAVQYNLLAGSRLYLYLSGFDPKWSRMSPGALLVRESIRAAISEGAREADFLRNAEDFKYLWGARDCTNYRLRVTHRD